MHGMKRTVVVTGASSGIGRAIGRRLLAEGHTVIGTSRQVGRFQASHGRFHPVEVDLSDLGALPDFIRHTQQAFPALDAVVFAAGAGMFGSLEEFSYRQIESALTLNFTSAAVMTRALLPAFKAKSRSDLIYIGSEAALKGSRMGTLYCAGKFALRGFTQALREECGKDGVKVCLVNPGMVQSPFFENLHFAPGEGENQHLLPDDVADAIAYVLHARHPAMVDEINLNPLVRVVRKKNRLDGE
jgi:3-hydroxy acid dehydrogenase / malonic semialdehyde reductase